MRFFFAPPAHRKDFLFSRLENRILYLIPLLVILALYLRGSALAQDQESLEELRERQRKELERKVEEQRKKWAEKSEEERRKEVAERIKREREEYNERLKRMAAEQERQRLVAEDAQETPGEEEPLDTTVTAAPRGPSSVLKMRPYQQKVQVGRPFITEITLYAESAGNFDRLHVRLNYPQYAIEPVQIFDYPIEKYIDKKNPPQTSSKTGLLAYDLELKEPMEFSGETPIMYVMWMAKREVEAADIILGRPGTPRSRNSAVYLDEKNLLESNLVLGSACLNAQVRIEGKESSKPGLRIIKEDAAILNADPTGLKGASLRIDVPDEKMLTGTYFVADVVLENPNEIPFDQLTLDIRFDPDKLQVLDWDRFNWIRRGINIFDGESHLRFPFNVHWRNEVSNSQGRIFYKMGFSEPQSLEGGVLAKIRCRTISADGAQSLHLARDEKNAQWMTDITDRGKSILKSISRPESSLLSSRN